MAETNEKTVRALIFESAAKSNALMRTEINIQGKIIPRELKFVDTVTRIRNNRDSNEVENKFTKLSNQRRFNFITTSSERTKPSVRMLVYEDSSEEEEGAEERRTTPPNPQERRRQAAAPGAPIKSRKEFDKKILRPKKLIYCSEVENEENSLYGRINEEDNVYKNLTEIITKPRKIIHLPTDEELNSSTNKQTISSSSRGGRKKSQNRNMNDATTTRRNGKSKNGTIDDDKENNAAVIATERNRDVGQASDSHKSRSTFLKNHDRGGAFAGSREEFANLSKPGEFTHFRI